MRMRGWLVSVAMGAGSVAASGQRAAGVEGTWRTPAGSVIQVYGCGGAVCLKILQVEQSAPGTEDQNNPDPALRSRSLCGLEIGSGFQPKDGGISADEGKLYDPQSGKTYSGTMTAGGADKLRLRGYLGVKLFGRTETWTRYTGETHGCRAD